MLREHIEVSTIVFLIVTVIVGSLFIIAISFFTEMDAVSTRAENKILKRELCRLEQSDYWCKNK